MEVAAFALTPVAVIAGAMGVLLLGFGNGYGFFGDELYFIAAGHHLDFSYVDQPPLVPFLAMVADTIAPGSLWVTHLPSVVVTVAGIFIAALTAWELGGGRRSQVIAAAVYCTAPLVAGGGHLLATSTIDLFFWTAITWLLVRWLRTRQDKLLLWAGIVTAVDLQVKYLIAFFWAVVAVAILIAGPRDFFRSKMLWLGGAIAVLTTLPSLIWQADHGWPQVDMARQIAYEESAGVGGPGMFLVFFAILLGIIGTPLAAYGLWRAARQPRYRFLAITAVALTVVFIATGGRPYYPAGIAAVLWALAAVGLEGPRKRWVPWVAWPALVLSGVLTVIGMPIAPVESVRGTETSDVTNAESIGWPQMANEVAAAYRALPDDVRRHTAIMGDSFWTAAVVDVYGPALGLPRAYSPSRGYWYFGVPPETATNVLYIGDNNADVVRAHFAKSVKVATVDNKLGIDNNYQGAPISLFSTKDASWSTLWPEIKTLTG
ncbi:ArnT family glycosyltransferase [Kutzneria sp. NPDC052558]|uniref:ArnT family glycosyltransferase n=1 Tax=Kutzneria sp. NPDC052558 TaxID=3364121 RepID=UPI0037C833AE